MYINICEVGQGMQVLYNREFLTIFMASLISLILKTVQNGNKGKTELI